MILNLDLLYIIKFYLHLEYMLFQYNQKYLLVNKITNKSLEFGIHKLLMSEDRNISLDCIYDLNNFRYYTFHNKVYYEISKKDLITAYNFIYSPFTKTENLIDLQIPKDILNFLNSNQQDFNCLKNIKNIYFLI